MAVGVQAVLYGPADTPAPRGTRPPLKPGNLLLLAAAVELHEIRNVVRVQRKVAARRHVAFRETHVRQRRERHAVCKIRKTPASLPDSPGSYL